MVEIIKMTAAGISINDVVKEIKRECESERDIDHNMPICTCMLQKATTILPMSELIFRDVRGYNENVILAIVKETAVECIDFLYV